jgi:hypothetical protein
MRTHDVRYGRPSVHAVYKPVYAHRPVPRVWTYRPYYTRWYCHPYYRYRYATWAVVGFGFAVHPWYSYWAPPARVGWGWAPGYYVDGYWTPGYWEPVRQAPAGYVYVPGWWEGGAYVEGYWRIARRSGWAWVDGYYLDDESYVRGHWEPENTGPEGYEWEAGFWDGQQYVDGFWRPQYRDGYAWVNAYYDEDGVYHSGYWMPTEERPGQVWIPGWFDGNEWVAGYWVAEDEVNEDALNSWQPPEGVDAGWDDEVDPRMAPQAELISEDSEEAPLALPITEE